MFWLKHWLWYLIWALIERLAGSITYVNTQIWPFHWNPASFRNLSYLGICCSKSLQQELPRIGEFFFITVDYSFIFVAIFFLISPENAYNSKIKSTRKKAVWKLSFLLRHFIFVLADVYDPLLRIRVSLTCTLIHPQPHVNKHIMFCAW